MAKKYDDPLFILTVLNSLGFIDVNTSVLQSFMKDLKTHRKIKEKAHKEWKKKIIRKALIQNRPMMERLMNDLLDEQAGRQRMVDAADSASDEQSSQYPKKFLHIAEVHHHDQSFEVEKSGVGEKRLIKTPEVTGKDRSLRPDPAAPGPSGKSPREKSKDQSRKILDTDLRKQQAVQYDFDVATDDSDSYRQLPGQTIKVGDKDKTQARKDKTLIGKTFDEHLFDTNIKASDSYKRLPKPREKLKAKDKSQTEKSKVPLKKIDDKNFSSSFETSDSYKQLPGAKEKISSKPKPQGTEKVTISLGRTFNKDLPSNLEASDSYKQIAWRTRVQEEDKGIDKSRRDETQTITAKNKSKNVREKLQQDKTRVSGTAVRTDAEESFIESNLSYSCSQQNIPLGKSSTPSDKKLPETQSKDPRKDKNIREESKIISAGMRTDAEENFIDSRLEYSNFKQNITRGRSSPIEKVQLGRESPEQFSLRNIRERSHLSYDSRSSSDSSQQNNRVETDLNLVVKDRALERHQQTWKGMREVTHLRFDDSDSESDSESNYLEQQEAIHLPDDNERERMNEQKKSQNSAQSTPNFRERSEINYDSSSKSDSESISQARARSKKEKDKGGKTTARPKNFKPNEFIERSHLEF